MVSAAPEKDLMYYIEGKHFDWVDDKNSIITTNLSSLLWGEFNVHYEMKQGKGNGLGFGLGVYWWSYGYWDTFGISVAGEYNWYFQEHALNGWYAGPRVEVGFSSSNYSYTWMGYNESDSSTSIFAGIGGQAGYRWIWKNGLTVDTRIGPMIRLGGDSAVGFSTLGWNAGSSIGYAF